MTKGYLQYDSDTKRFVFVSDDGKRRLALHCGWGLDVYDGSKWLETRIEMGSKGWYLIYTPYDEDNMNGLRVRMEL